MISYHITGFASGKSGNILINETQFNSLKLARNRLSEALRFEEKHDLLISNYLEIEKECLNIASEQIVIDTYSYQHTYNTHALINRRIMNLLTSVRLYQDYLTKHINHFQNESTKQTAKNLLSNQYDNSVEYRFMEALRNHAQHYGLIVHLSELGGKRTEDSGHNMLEYKAHFFSLKKYISKNRKFNKTVYSEMPEKVNLILYIRSYIECLSEVHVEVRNLITSSINSARDAISKAIESFENTHGDKSVGLESVAFESDNQQVVESFPVILEWDDIRIGLSKKTENLKNLKNKYVSSKASSE